MQINVITLFPEMFTAITECGITSKAAKQGLIELDYFNPREFASLIMRRFSSRVRTPSRSITSVVVLNTESAPTFSPLTC